MGRSHFIWKAIARNRNERDLSILAGQGRAVNRRVCQELRAIPTYRWLTEKAAGKMMTLDLPTWSATAEMAADSHAVGGYPIPIDNYVGLRVRREIAVWSWPK
ncbi:MAG: hypothetical protein O3C60_07945 [Planctomycetota bacterium]|nr:hypothetical protein [Planctomycetota bacterium]